MRLTARTLLSCAMLGLLITASASAQTLEEVCPGAVDGTGAVVGVVTDSDAEMVLPGAKVIAAWSADGVPARAEGDVGFDGVYTICHLPLNTAISLHASFAAMEGAPIDVTMTEIFTRQDLGISTAAVTTLGGDGRLWMCINDGQSEINLQFSRLVRCEEEWQPLEQCPKEELGRISVQPIGAGSGMMREMLEQFVQEAQRLGANAAVNVLDARGGTSFGGAGHMTSMTGEAVRIEVDPSTC